MHASYLQIPVHHPIVMYVIFLCVHTHTHTHTLYACIVPSDPCAPPNCYVCNIFVCTYTHTHIHCMHASYLQIPVHHPIVMYVINSVQDLPHDGFDHTIIRRFEILFSASCVCMYVCMCIYVEDLTIRSFGGLKFFSLHHVYVMCVHVSHVCITCMYACMHHMHVCMHVCMYHMHVCMYYVHVCMYACMYVCMFVYMCTRVSRIDFSPPSNTWHPPPIHHVYLSLVCMYAYM
jgi:hypothetical protein